MPKPKEEKKVDAVEAAAEKKLREKEAKALRTKMELLRGETAHKSARFLKMHGF